MCRGDHHESAERLLKNIELIQSYAIREGLTVKIFELLDHQLEILRKHFDMDPTLITHITPYGPYKVIKKC